VVSATDQKMVVLTEGSKVKEYPVSTSKFGVGDAKGSYQTPLGKMKVARKIGGDVPAGTVFKSRQPTGEVLPVNAPGRDPIVTRIIWLSGTESQNMNAFRRFIYIHGTPEERNIGRPASYGCIRMRSEDIIDLYKRLPVGSEVYVTMQRFQDGGNSLSAGQGRGNGRSSAHAAAARVGREVVKETEERIAMNADPAATADAGAEAGKAAPLPPEPAATEAAAVPASATAATTEWPAPEAAEAAGTAGTAETAKPAAEPRRGPFGIFGRVLPSK
jgi:hypothetical protein